MAIKVAQKHASQRRILRCSINTSRGTRQKVDNTTINDLQKFVTLKLIGGASVRSCVLLRLYENAILSPYLNNEAGSRQRMIRNRF